MFVWPGGMAEPGNVASLNGSADSTASHEERCNGARDELWDCCEREIAEEVGIQPSDKRDVRFLGFAYRSADYVPVAIFSVRFPELTKVDL